MSDEIKNEDEDVQAHGRVPSASDEPAGDDDDDVEAHARLTS